MFMPVGLAAVNQGYQDAATNYWKMVQAEDTQAALGAIGQTAASMMGMPGGMQNAPQAAGTQSNVMQSAPQQANIPSGPPPMIPSSGGAAPPVSGAPTVPAAPPRPMIPGPFGPGGPPMGFTNPLNVGGQPQNVTGDIIPFGGTGAQPPVGGGQPSGPVSPPGAGPGGLSAGGVPPALEQAFAQRLGPAPYDWRQLAAELVRANPGIKPAVVGRALTMMLPLMQSDAQQQWRQIQEHLALEKIGETERSHKATEEGRAAALEELKRRTDLRETRLKEAFAATKEWRQYQQAFKEATSLEKQDEASRKRAIQLARDRHAIYYRAQQQIITGDSNLNDEDKQRSRADIALEKERALAELDAIEKSPTFNPLPGAAPTSAGAVQDRSPANAPPAGAVKTMKWNSKTRQFE